MRGIAVISLLVVLAACTTTKDLSPREVLDEQTAATLTIVADPVIFAGQSAPRGLDRGRFALSEGVVNSDYLELYGIDINRMGQHRQYFVVQRWLGAKDAATLPVLELISDGSVIELHAASEDARQLGISSLPAPAFSKSSQWWYYPTDTATLKKVAAAREVAATLVIGDHRIAYELFSDGRAQLGELATVLR